MAQQLRLLLLVAMVMVMGTGLRTTVAQPYSRIFVFGDSLSDIGNIFIATQEAIPVSPPYFMGRFSNGPVWIERLAQTFALEMSPSLAGGTNFAFGGAETGQEVEELFEQEIDVLIPSLRVQVLTFLASDFIGGPLAEADAEALYVVWGGPNDLRKAAMEGTTDPAAAAQGAVADLTAAIRELVDAGAELFLVLNLPNLGLTPESRALGPEAMTLAMDLSVRFNNALATALDTIVAETGVTIFRLDVFTALENAVANPAGFGFSNVTTSCLQGDASVGGTPCANPEAHLFWDAIHPTAAAHAILANAALLATRPPLTITPGDANPGDFISLSDAVQALSVLQVRLRTAGETILLNRVNVVFSDRMGADDRIETLRAHAVNDTNGNGQIDAGETVLATTEVQQAVDTLPVDIMPPLSIPAESEVHLLLTLDVNAPVGVTAAMGISHFSLRHQPFLFAGFAGFSVLLGLLLYARRYQPRRLAQGLLILILGCGLGAAGCSDDIVDSLTNGDRDALTFTVEIPPVGIIGQGIMAGPVAGPAVPIAGLTLTITP